jgi:hypothetical protein
MLSTLDTLPQNGAKSVKRVEGLGEKVHGPRSQLHTPETCATWQELVRQRGHPEDGYQGREMDGRGPEEEAGTNFGGIHTEVRTRVR